MGNDITTAIDNAVDAAMGRPFSWGLDNCGLWPANIVRDATGVDYAAPLRGQYTTARGALLRLRKFAGGGLTEAIEKIADAWGWRPVDAEAEFFECGDIGISGRGVRAFLLIFDGRNWLGREDKGVGYFQEWTPHSVWRLPCLR